jgi:catechol 2,3-dioxygenase-like lactoylglutathione lyase family enzyme
MLKISHVNVWVHDQDEALEWYTKRLGMELREDVTLPELGDFRWLSVSPPGQPDVALVLMAIPGPPVFDEDTRQKLTEVLGKGAAGGIFLQTDDCRAQYEELSKRGVEFTEPPSERPYGVDAGLRDPSGNAIRLVQSAVAPVTG